MDFFLARWVRRLRVLGERTRLEREMDEEMRFHVEMEAEELHRVHGLSAEEARRRALIAFGGVERHKEAGRDARWYGWLEGMSLDLKLGLRMLRKSPALSVIGGLGMALVVGLMTLAVLLLSAAGVSALMSFAVTRRQREIGVRIALGAPRGRVMAAIFSRSARQLALGLLAGAAAGGMLDRLTGGELLGGRALILLPRALRIHPVEALRQE